jgi:hypothetical protein
MAIFINDPMKKWANKLTELFQGTKSIWLKKHMKKCSLSLAIRKCQSKPH